MLKIFVCVGSSCHLKGSYFIIKTFLELIDKYNLQSKAEVKASFCLGHCTSKGVCVKIMDSFIEDISEENIEEKFFEYVINRI